VKQIAVIELRNEVKLTAAQGHSTAAAVVKIRNEVKRTAAQGH
jgi:hypothetical protein